MPETKSGNKHIITAIDYATRWVVAKAVSRMDSDTVAEFLYNNILLNYGAPFELISDRGAALISETLSNFEKLQGMRHFASTPYHPQTNGMVERMHAMVGHAITTLSSGKPERWDEYLPQSIFAIRVRKHAVTKHSPFYLLYGVHPRIPGDTNPLESTMQPLDELETMVNLLPAPLNNLVILDVLLTNVPKYRLMSCENATTSIRMLIWSS